VRREGLLLIYMIILLVLLEPVRKTLGAPLLILAVASMVSGYLLALRLPEKAYRWLDERRELLFFWNSTLFLIALLVLLLYNFFREPRGIKEIMLQGEGVGPLSWLLLLALSLVAGASLGKSSRVGLKYPIATSLFTFLPIVMVCYLLNPAPSDSFNFFKEAALAVLFVAAVEETWSGGRRTERLYNLQNILLATFCWILSYLIWMWLMPPFYSSRLFAGMYISLLLSFIMVAVALTIYWSYKKHV